jgi:hypothetical protein
MPSPPLPRRLLTTARWPAGIVITGWAYTWRVTPIHRRELAGELPRDAPPPLPPGTNTKGLQVPEDGQGSLLRRRYRVDIVDADRNAQELIAALREDPNQVAPWGLAHFQKSQGDNGRLELGDEYSVRMPGPWNGPVRVIEVTPTSWRLGTLDSHLEAGQIEWRARDRKHGVLRFEIESWSRPGDRLSNVLHHHLGMAKEVQLHMWTSVLEKTTRFVGGRMQDGVDIKTLVAD